LADEANPELYDAPALPKSKIDPIPMMLLFLLHKYLYI
jgi:hypothetical protein